MYGFDIQKQAILNSTLLLKQKALYNNYNLFQESHENIIKVISPEHIGKIRAVIFNLGFLPRADNNITTKSNSTLNALNSSLTVLELQGIISIMIYSGHEEGAKEKDIIFSWASNLNYTKYRVYLYEVFNKKKNKETLLIIKKIAI